MSRPRMNIHVRKVPVPHASLISGALSRIDYADSYAAEFESSRDLSPVDAARAFFRSFPSWVIVLLRIRNAVVAVFRLKTGDGAAVEEHLARFTGVKGQSVAGFEVFDSSPVELLMGADDRHLDFRLSFFLERNGRKYVCSIATTVQFNGLLGRAYFVPVGPFHRIIVPAILARMIRDHLAENGNA